MNIRFLYTVLMLISSDLLAAKHCELWYARVYGLNQPERGILSSPDLDGNFLVLPKKTPKENSRMNAETIMKLKKESLPRYSKRKKFLTIPEIDELYQRAVSNRQVAESACGRYRGSQNFGFCFGRAFATHMFALDSGLSNKSVRKLFAVGDLRRKSDGTKWQYHVTTLVRGPGGDWYAIDPIMDEPMTLGEWVKHMRENYDKEKTMRIFATPANKLSAGQGNHYDPSALAANVYHGFFADFLDEFQREATGKPGSWANIKGDTDKKLLETKTKEMQKFLWRVGFTGATIGSAYAGMEIYNASK